jgi:membrane protein DedA with SNARE-associated domain
MTLAGLLATYGYLAVAVGTFLEGETILLMAGFAAHRGYLDLWKVILVAFVASFLGDQYYFFLGQRYGDRILARFPSWKPRAKKVLALLRKYDTALVLGIRFLYGLRTVGPIVIGMSHVPLFRLVTLNAIGAAIWAPLIAGGGYLLGNTLELVLADVKRYEEIVLVLLAFLGLRTAHQINCSRSGRGTWSLCVPLRSNGS